MKILLLFLCFLFSAIGLVFLLIEEFDWVMLASFLFFGLGFFVLLFEKRITSWRDRILAQKQAASYCLFKTDGIYFKKYPYQYGYYKDKQTLLYSQVEEIWVNTFPPVAKVGNELIFLLASDQDQVKRSCELHNIPMVSPTDNWYYLCEEFLDTEFDDETRKNSLRTLEKCGFSKAEVEQIRERIKGRMLLLTSISWEWIHYGQLDVLQVSPPTEKNYWWSMEIALRGSSKS